MPGPLHGPSTVAYAVLRVTMGLGRPTKTHENPFNARAESRDGEVVATVTAGPAAQQAPA